MAVFKVEAENNADIDKKPRVYFTCHPEDFEKHFKTICEDIFNTHDCAVYYTEDMTEAIAEEEKELDLGRNNLFVVPVTFKLLTIPNRAMDEDIPYALKEHIPVLPIMMEPGLVTFYSRPDKFGELQYLNPYSADLTEISYEEKLKKYLESVLISDELAKRVRAAFDAYIFLSYRKKDRKYANELMRLIHSHPECRDIAVWFDEFLTPGESFKENIEKILDDCQLFTLLVTPQLLEKVVDKNGEERDNYVLSTELPLARKKQQEKGIDIFAVEMEDTNKEALSAIAIEDYVNSGDDAFRERLLDTVSRMAITTNDTPEHNFLIGLAYLDGIDVEKNHDRALTLITDAASNNVPEAMAKLVEYYSTADTLHYEKSVFWATRMVDHAVQQHGEDSEEALRAKNILAFQYEYAGNYKEALKLRKQLCKQSRDLLNKHDDYTLQLFTDLANVYLRCDKAGDALKVLNQLHASLQDIPDKSLHHTLHSLSSLALAHCAKGNYNEALRYQTQAYRLWKQTYGEKHFVTIIMLDNLGDIYHMMGEYAEALARRKKASALFNDTLGPEHFHTLIALDNLAETYIDYGNPKRALRIRQDTYPLFYKTLGEDHPETLTAFNNLAKTYGAVAEYDEALRLHTQAYESLRKVMGEKHSRTLAALNGIGYALGKLGRHREALESRQKEYEQRCETLGPTHKETLISLNNVACSHSFLGNPREALRLHKQVYSLRKNALGENHIDTKESVQNVRDATVAYALWQSLHPNNDPQD